MSETPQSTYAGPDAPVYPPIQPQAGKGEGEKYAEHALIFGIIGLILFGIVLGPLAIINAKKAEVRGVNATAGRILGWVGTVFAALSIVISAAVFFFTILVAMSSGN